jgi:hypothetical protein
MMRSLHKFFDYVTRRFGASSAEPKKPRGLDLRWNRRLARSPDFTWNPESAEMRSLVGTSLTVRVLFGSVRNCIAVDNPMPKKKWRR